MTSLDTLSNVIATVVVTDDSGNVTSAAPLAIRTIPSNAAAPLEVRLASPVTGASYTAGGQIVFAASHNAGNRPSPVIDYYVNGSIFTTVTTLAFSQAFLTKSFQVAVQLVKSHLFKINLLQLSITATTMVLVSLQAFLVQLLPKDCQMVLRLVKSNPFECSDCRRLRWRRILQQVLITTRMKILVILHAFLILSM